jgi:hypothetical protein
MNFSNVSNSNVTSSSSVSVALSTTSCCLSIFGAFAIFGTYYFIPEIRNTTRKLLLCLTVADFLTAAGKYPRSISKFDLKFIKMLCNCLFLMDQNRFLPVVSQTVSSNLIICLLIAVNNNVKTINS